MALPRFQGVRKLDGLGITLADLLKELNELRNKQPEKYLEIIEVVKPIFVGVPEYIEIIKEVYVELPPKEIIKIMFPAGVIGTTTLEEIPLVVDMGKKFIPIGKVNVYAT